MRGKQGREASGRTAPRVAEDPAVPGERGARATSPLAARPRSASPLPAWPRGAGTPLASRPGSLTSVPSLPPSTRPCGFPGPAALSPPPPFVSKAREQALKESGGWGGVGGGGSICFRFVRLREVDRRSGVQTLPANAAGAASRVAGAACPGRAAGPGSERSPPPARSPPLPIVLLLPPRPPPRSFPLLSPPLLSPPLRRAHAPAQPRREGCAEPRREPVSRGAAAAAAAAGLRREG